MKVRSITAAAVLAGSVVLPTSVACTPEPPTGCSAGIGLHLQQGPQRLMNTGVISCYGNWVPSWAQLAIDSCQSWALWAGVPLCGSWARYAQSSMEQFWTDPHNLTAAWNFCRPNGLGWHQYRAGVNMIVGGTGPSTWQWKYNSSWVYNCG